MTRHDLAIIVVAVLLAAVIRVVFYPGMFSPDTANYLRNAAAWWTGHFEMKDALYLHDTRLLMFVPVAWSFVLFGVSEVTALLWPFLASLAVVVFVYVIAKRLFTRETAVWAAFCAAFFPLLAREGTLLLPGAVMNFLIAASTFCFVVSEQTKKRRWMWLAFSGMAFGAIQLAGELGGVLGLMFVAAVIVWRRHSVWSYWPVAAGFAAVTGLIVSYYWIVTGDLLFKLQLSKEVYAHLMNVAPSQPLFYTRMILAPGGGGIYYLAGIGAVAAVFKRRREALFLILWAALTWLVLEFGSVSLSKYQQLSKEGRYFSVVSVPIVILAGYGMASMRAFLATRRLVLGRVAPGGVIAAAALSMVFLSVWTLRSHKNAKKGQRTALHKLQEEVRRYEGKPIYVTHWLWNTEVGFLMRFEADYLPSGYDPWHAVHLESADSTSLNRYVQTLTPGESMGAGLLVHDERLFELSQVEGGSSFARRGEIPEQLAHMPPDWRLIERIVVSKSYVLALHEIPEGATWPAADRR